MYIRGIDRIVRFSGLQKALEDIYGPDFASNLYIPSPKMFEPLLSWESSTTIEVELFWTDQTVRVRPRALPFSYNSTFTRIPRHQPRITLYIWLGDMPDAVGWGAPDGVVAVQVPNFARLVIKSSAASTPAIIAKGGKNYQSSTTVLGP
jgi:hypothetical protein